MCRPRSPSRPRSTARRGSQRLRLHHPADDPSQHLDQPDADDAADARRVFTLIFVMTGGGPGTDSSTLPILAYQEAFKFGELGFGTAIATSCCCRRGLLAHLHPRPQAGGGLMTMTTDRHQATDQRSPARRARSLAASPRPATTACCEHRADRHRVAASSLPLVWLVARLGRPDSDAVGHAARRRSRSTTSSRADAGAAFIPLLELARAVGGLPRSSPSSSRCSRPTRSRGTRCASTSRSSTRCSSAPACRSRR